LVTSASLPGRAQAPAANPQQAAVEKAPYFDPSLTFEARAADLVSRMTVDEKIGQLMHAAPAIPRLGVPAYNWWNEGLVRHPPHARGGDGDQRRSPREAP
jgi:hypothetical protein